MKIKGAMPTTEGIVVPESLADRIDVRCTAKLRDYETKAINLALTVTAQQFAYEKPVIRNRAQDIMFGICRTFVGIFVVFLLFSREFPVTLL